MITGSAPRPWRVVSFGDEGGDVTALQRCLWRLLDKQSHNLRNGRYGDGTVKDVLAARRLLHAPGPSDSVGAELVGHLWQWADAAAVSAFVRAPEPLRHAAGAVVHRTLTKGLRGPDVEAAQRGLWRLLGGAATNARSGLYGDQTEADVKRARALLDLEDPIGGHAIGHDLFAVLTRWFDATAADAATHAPKPHPASREHALRVAIVQQWRWAWLNASRFRYAQLRPMPGSLHEAGTVHTDCSGFCILGHKDGGAPNPNRADGKYDGYGWTGSIMQVCHRVGTPLPADFALYSANGGHMAGIAEDGVSIYSDGHDPITRYTTVHYRSDFVGFFRSPHLPGNVDHAALAADLSEPVTQIEVEFGQPAASSEATEPDLGDAQSAGGPSIDEFGEHSDA